MMIKDVHTVTLYIFILQSVSNKLYKTLVADLLYVIIIIIILTLSTLKYNTNKSASYKWRLILSAHKSIVSNYFRSLDSYSEQAWF